MSVASFTPLLKEHYDKQTVQNLISKDNPLIAMLAKKEDFTGVNYRLPLIYGNPQNRSATFATAQAGTSALSSASFALTRVANYSTVTVSNEEILASEGDKGAFIESLKSNIDGAMVTLANDIAFSLCRDSSGYRGTVLAEPAEAATTVITLGSIGDHVGFAKDQVLVIYSAKSGGSQRIFATSVTTGTITAIDRSAGTITISRTYDANGTITAGDYLFVEGDRGSKMAGLESWVPDSAPSATTFFGVDRSVDTVLLGGNRTVGTGMPIEEALISAAQDIALNGGRPDVCVMSVKQYSRLLKQQTGKVQFVDVDVAGLSFRAIELHGGHGSIKVFSDRNMRADVAYLLDLSTWKLCSLGPLVSIINGDGNEMLRQSTADGYEIRVGSYANLGCNAPGRNGVVTLDA